MKLVINLEGQEVSVANNTSVKMIDGVNYLLSDQEKTELQERDTAWEAEKADYEANHKFKDDRKIAYGTWEEQMERLYKDQRDGTSTFKDYQDQVRAAIPDPRI